MSKQYYGVATKQGTFRATMTTSGVTVYIGESHNNMRDAILDIPAEHRGAYGRWV